MERSGTTVKSIVGRACFWMLNLFQIIYPHNQNGTPQTQFLTQVEFHVGKLMARQTVPPCQIFSATYTLFSRDWTPSFLSFIVDLRVS